MTVARDALYGLYGATRLARFDSAGIGYFDGTVDSAWRSFWANLFTLPAYWLWLLLQPSTIADQVGLLSFLTVEGLAFAIKLLAYLLVVHQVMEMMGSPERVPGFIAAYNWSSVLQMGVFLLTTTLIVGELLPDPVGQAVGQVAIFWALGFAWFMVRHTLNVHPLGALGILALELLVTALVNDLTDALVWRQV